MKDEFVRIAMQGAGIGRKKAENLWAAGFRYTAGLPPAEQHQGEPVAWRVGSQIFQQEHLAKIHSGGVSKPVEPLYPHADPAEVERLRTELALKVQTQNCDTLRAKLAKWDLLLRGIADHCNGCVMPTEQLLREWGSSIDAALSASAEPTAPVERDERAENSERYLWLKENVTSGSLGIPGGWVDDETEHWDRIIDAGRKP